MRSGAVMGENRTFAALRFEVRNADQAAVQFIAFADAAFIRECSVFFAFMTRASPKQPLKFGCSNAQNIKSR